MMGSPIEIRRQLADAVESRTLMRVGRSPRNADTVGGFPVSVGSKWVLISHTRDGGFFDGLVAVRLRDIVKVQRDTTFEARFARTQPEWPPAAPAEIDLGTTGGLIKDLGQISSLIGIEQERKHDSAMRWIGVVDELDDGCLWLREVRPDATWRKQPRGYRLKHITKVVVADQYLTALRVVAGPGPEAERP